MTHSHCFKKFYIPVSSLLSSIIEEEPHSNEEPIQPIAAVRRMQFSGQINIYLWVGWGGLASHFQGLF